MKRFIAVSLLFACTLLVSCAAPDVQHYQDTGPEFNFKQFFNGKLKAYGVVQDFKGELTRKLVVEMNAYWEGNKGTIEEDFVYDDGETQRRVWHITLNDDNTLTGTASDVLGIAQGKSSGSVFHWTYSLVLEVDDSEIEVDFDDWMYLVTQSRLINRTAIDKFGVEVGEVTLVIEKVE
ncbi:MULTISPECIES: DUF3833 domain-containing protein [unclassified Pseudoalteromonas]|uniref:DUF3833 domain-containing protein n=1 Tax=unclassified Pseudoalteromonas TaxID=194690 RepID=UPI000B3BF240|nr:MULTISPECIES: DUF3833 domain-containing protein [unclassified Pseudoalteromonas]MDN3379897.1 DUF3833 domain-containing protein [Pseudoalteromonas sp. APC 3893]MDN3388236.1 DUF3833 domain-containing protein [Pseudoalteromonas sp. APC 4017]OUS73530.1 hypothetical protein B5G52_04605 [Pseudoalteromonas sp. A601]